MLALPCWKERKEKKWKRGEEKKEDRKKEKEKRGVEKNVLKKRKKMGGEKKE
jgi:hypothetical protein